MNNKTNQKHSIHISKKLDKFFEIEGQNFIVNDLENYCCFWIYTKKQFKTFLNSFKIEEFPINNLREVGVPSRKILHARGRGSKSRSRVADVARGPGAQKISKKV